MIPIRDTIRSRTTPYVNYTLIAISVLTFLLQISTGQGSSEAFFRMFAVTPREIHETILQFRPTVHSVATLVTSMFVHGGWGHLIGNILYLHVFGDNVEDRLGHGSYAVFYLLCGTGASLAEILAQGPSGVPLVGASGAIAGVLGAYFLLFPRARVLTIIPLLFVFPVVQISAWFFLGFWFLLQFVQGSISLGETGGGGVAWWAHTGGFLAGAALLPFFLLLRRIRS